MHIFHESAKIIHRNKSSSNTNVYNCLLYKYAVEELEFRVRYAIDKCHSLNNIIEVGARHGIFTKVLKKICNDKFYNTNITALDTSILLNQNRWADLLYLQSNIYDITLGINNDAKQQSQKLYLKPDFYDMSVSILNMHWINDVHLWLKSINFLLKKDGVFICSLFGENTLNNLRKYLLKLEMNYNKDNHHMHVMPFIKASDISSLLQNSGFTNIVSDIDSLNIRYRNAKELMLFLKSIGENGAFYNKNVLSTLPISKAMHNYIMEDRNELIAQYDIITFIAHKV